MEIQYFCFNSDRIDYDRNRQMMLDKFLIIKCPIEYFTPTDICATVDLCYNSCL